VLFMSGYSDEDLSRSGSLPRGARLLHKPFSPETLVGAVRELVPRGH
jgi:DNA-binding response OmpR family regulator